jgi:hypothetical protein
MRRAIFLVLAVAALVAAGCVQDQMYCRSCGQGATAALCGSCADCPETCQSCDPYGGGACAACGPGAMGPYDPEAQGAFCPGPPTGAVTYPYYTVRGPRDFLARDIRPVGP